LLLAFTARVSFSARLCSLPLAGPCRTLATRKSALIIHGIRESWHSRISNGSSSRKPSNTNALSVEPETEQEKALASWFRRNTHARRGRREDLWGTGFTKGDLRTREY
jgi:hypothetical protein